MLRGKHRVKRFRRGTIVLLTVAGLLLTAVAGSAVAAIRYDHRYAGRMLPGLSIDGVAVGGMTRAQALQAVTAKVQQTVFAAKMKLKQAEQLQTRVTLSEQKLQDRKERRRDDEDAARIAQRRVSGARK